MFRALPHLKSHQPVRASTLSIRKRAGVADQGDDRAGRHHAGAESDSSCTSAANPCSRSPSNTSEDVSGLRARKPYLSATRNSHQRTKADGIESVGVALAQRTPPTFNLQNKRETRLLAKAQSLHFTYIF